MSLNMCCVTESASSSKTGVIVGSVMAGLVVIIVIVGVVVYIFKRSNKVADSGEDSQYKVLDIGEEDDDTHSIDDEHKIQTQRDAENLDSFRANVPGAAEVSHLK